MTNGNERDPVSCWPVISVTLVTWASVVCWGALLDDHFGRITLGYQWLTYGHVPFRDFFDPGLFGAAAWSAVGLWLSGGSLLGEMVLDGAAMGLGLGIACALATRATRSAAVGILCALLTLAAGPRLYDYDKILLYPLGLWACWRYADDPTTRRAVAIGMVIGLGASFRYDTALYLGAAWLTALVAIHGLSQRLAQRVAISTAVAGLVVSPIALWVHSTVGLRDAIDQVVTYAQIERRRTVLFEWSSVLRDGALTEAWAAIMSRGPAAGVLYLGLLALVPLGIAVAFSKRLRAPSADGGVERPHVLSAAVLCGVLVIFILRDPLPARYGAMLSIAAVLGACIAGPWLPAGSLTRSPRQLTMALALGVVAGVTVIQAGEIDRFERLWLGGPQDVVPFARARVRMLAETPPSLGIMPGGPTSKGLAWYLRQCTPPGAPVMVTWFAPHVYYFAQRPFAGGIWAFFGDHWTRPDRQQQVVERLKRSPPSIVVFDRTRFDDVRQSYSLIVDYLHREYRPAGSTNFDRPVAPQFDVLVQRDSVWKGRDASWGLVCDPAARESRD